MHPFDSMTPEEQKLFEQEAASWAQEMGLGDPPSEAAISEMEQQNQQWQADQMRYQSITGFVKDCVSVGRSLAPYRDEINRRIQDAIYAAESEYEFNSDAESVYGDAAAHAEAVLANEGYQEGDSIPAYLEQQMGGRLPSELRTEGQSLAESAEQIRENSLMRVYEDAYAVDKADKSILLPDTRSALGEEYTAFCERQREGQSKNMSGLSGIDFGKSAAAPAVPEPVQEKSPTVQRSDKSRESHKGVNNGFKTPARRYIPAAYEEFNNPIDNPDYGFDEGEFV